jgi:hypothetical protein
MNAALAKLSHDQVQSEIRRMIQNLERATREKRTESWARPLLPFAHELQQLASQMPPDIARVRNFRIRAAKHLSDNKIKGLAEMIWFADWIEHHSESNA